VSRSLEDSLDTDSVNAFFPANDSVVLHTQHYYSSAEETVMAKFHLDHRAHLAEIKDQSTGQTYSVLSQRKVIPAYVQLEQRNGPKKPARPKLYPKKEVIEVFVSNGKLVWGSEICFEEHNISRIRPGGRDETWTEEIFFREVQMALQYSSLDPTCLFQLRPIQEDFNFEIKARRGDIVVNYLKPCQLSRLEDLDSQTVLERIELENNALIHFFCSRGDLVKLQLCLEGRAAVSDINLVEKGCWAPIQRAAYSGHLEVVHYLIVKGANVDVQSDDGMDPMCCAIKGGHLPIVQLLSESGARIRMDENTEDAPGREGHLTYALTCRQREIAEYLDRPDGQLRQELTSLNGARRTGPPEPPRFFTTIDGYPVTHIDPVKSAVKKRKTAQAKDKKIHPHAPHAAHHSKR
jgi:hypothetical protein